MCECVGVHVCSHVEKKRSPMYLYMCVCARTCTCVRVSACVCVCLTFRQISYEVKWRQIEKKGFGTKISAEEKVANYTFDLIFRVCFCFGAKDKEK